MGTVSGRPAAAWILVGLMSVDAGAACSVYFWLAAAFGAIPYGAPWPPAFWLVAEIAVLTFVLDGMIWRATKEIRRSAQARTAPFVGAPR